MRFEHATYDRSGSGAGVGRRHAGDAKVTTVVIEGDFMSIEAPVRFDLC
jgi:hypothetical protein